MIHTIRWRDFRLMTDISLSIQSPTSLLLTPRTALQQQRPKQGRERRRADMIKRKAQDQRQGSDRLQPDSMHPHHEPSISVFRISFIAFKKGSQESADPVLNKTASVRQRDSWCKREPQAADPAAPTKAPSAKCMSLSSLLSAEISLPHVTILSL